MFNFYVSALNYYAVDSGLLGNRNQAMWILLFLSSLSTAGALCEELWLRDACHSSLPEINTPRKCSLKVSPCAPQFRDGKSPAALRFSDSALLVQRQAVSDKPSVLIRFIEQ